MPSSLLGSSLLELRQDRKRLKLRAPSRAAGVRKKLDILQFDVMLIPFPGHLISFAQ